MSQADHFELLPTTEYTRKLDGFIEILTEDSRKRLANNIRRYFAPSVTLRVISDGQMDKLATERDIPHPISVMIVDIRDFVKTIRVLEQHDSGMERGRDLLQKFFDITLNIVFSYGGMVGEFAGDRIMAVFGVPVEQHDHALRAVQAAIEIEEAIQKRIKIRGFDVNASAITVGIGIHSDTGSYISDVGSGWRRELILIGSIINVTSRIEELTKQADIRTIPGRNILISAASALLLPNNVEYVNVGEHMIRGYHNAELDTIEDVHMEIFKITVQKVSDNNIIAFPQSDTLKQVVADLAEYVESFTERKRSQKYRSALENISMLWMSGAGLTDMLHEVMTIICDLLDAQNGTIWLINRDKTQLVPEIVVPSSTKVEPKPIGEGYVGTVAATGKTMLLTDAKRQSDVNVTHSQSDEALARYTVRSMLAVPISLRGEPIGVIQLLHNQPGKFDLEDEDTLNSVAAETALVLEKAQLEEEKLAIKRTSEQLETFRQLSTDILEHVRLSLVKQSNPEDLLKSIMDGMVNVLNARYATLYLVDWSQHELEFKIVIPYLSAESLPPRHPFSKGGIAVHVAQTGEGILIGDLDKQSDVKRSDNYDQATQFHPRSMLCVPVEARGAISAVLQVMDSEPYKFDQVDLDVLKLLASTAGIALESVLEYRRRTRAEQIASMSLMAGNMVHHFNNEVGLIPPTIEFLSDIIMDWGLPESQHAFLDKNFQKIVTSARNALNYVKIIREPFESKPNPTDVRTAIMEGIRKAQVPNSIQIESVLRDDLPVVLASPELNIVFRDLIKNASEAMMNSIIKRIRIYCDYDGLDMVDIFVEDTGPGVSPQQRNQLFQSYGTVSTKGDGNMGFGLFLANYYVEVMGGKLALDQDYKDGAKFRISLQVAKDKL